MIHTLFSFICLIASNCLSDNSICNFSSFFFIKLSKKSVEASKQANLNVATFKEQAVLLQRTTKEATQTFAPAIQELKTYANEIKALELNLKTADKHTQEILSQTTFASSQIENKIQHMESLIKSYILDSKKTGTLLDEKLKQANQVLTTQNEALGKTKLIISSHSPYLIQYLKSTQLFVGVPSNDGVAIFKRIVLLTFFVKNC